jgi:hypothetical protein
MGVYAVLMTILMVASMYNVQISIGKGGWRGAWSSIGFVLIWCVPVIFFLTPWRFVGKGPAKNEPISSGDTNSATLTQALLSPCFWTFALAISLFGLISAGFSLFQQTIFAAQGLDEGVYHRVLLMGLGVGLLSNLVGGGLATFIRLERLLAGAMLLLAVSLGGVPLISTPTHAYIFCLAYGAAGGVLTVLFFTVWGPAFGTRSLGRIQGAAQMLTVLFSAAGPLCVSGFRLLVGDDILFLCAAAVFSLQLAVVAWCIPVPSAAAGDWDKKRAASADKTINPLPETAS